MAGNTIQGRLLVLPDADDTAVGGGGGGGGVAQCVLTPAQECHRSNTAQTKCKRAAATDIFPVLMNPEGDQLGSGSR